MGIRNELTEQDQRLLEKIDEIVANESGERREVDSLYGFCAHLASTVPQADNVFRQRLEARLVARLQRRGTQAEEAHFHSRFQGLVPDIGRTLLRVNLVRHRLALATVALFAVIVAAFVAYPPTQTWARDVLVQFGTLVINVVPAQWETPQVTHAPAPDREPTRTPVAFSSPIQVVEKVRDGTSQWPVPLGYVSTWAVHRAR